MKIAYLDCFSGISGDMFLGALLACGLDLRDLEKGLKSLPLGGWRIQATKVKRQGIEGVSVEVEADADHPQRHLKEILDLIASSSLPPKVKDQAASVFRRLAEAEGRVHGISPEEVHFHEVGAVDAIIDVVGACWGLHLLEVERLYSSPLPLGRGWIRCHHGYLPLPAPATAYLLEDIPVYGSEIEEEMVTPTGAALVSTLVSAFGGLPAMRIKSSGYGAGKRELPRPNLLRLFLGEAEEIGRKDLAAGDERVAVVETNIDDMNPEFFPILIQETLAAGAVEAFVVPVQMKKGRPGFVFTALCPPERLHRVTRAVFEHSTTLGVRIREEVRLVAKRQSAPVPTPYGEVMVKWGVLNPREGIPLNVAPEFESCLRVARDKGVPLKEVYAAALASAREKGPPANLWDEKRQ